MTHPITPPPELVREWNQDAIGTHFEPYGYSEFIAVRAAQWGADQELEACCEWLEDVICDDPQDTAKELRSARRPKPPSLKEQALETLKYPKDLWSELEVDTIRLALEALPND
jgi:hypothetical protein